ncbi:MAG: tRNA (guanosine(37)-N1)-methyltransferase TrmD [Acidobacteriota bacterium]|nr:tRNA (guanosine(37)-N1)-methyltransferase TrmD [Acidobacteriota bacterium]
MRIGIVTIFPELFEPFLRTSLVGRAVESGRMEISVHDLRDYTEDRHRSVDDEPYGGGGGMVMTAQPWLAAVRSLSEAEAPSEEGRAPAGKPWRVAMSPQGAPLTEEKVRELADRPWLLLLCGRYEGIDERVYEAVVDEEVSIGDYVLSGGEIPAMVLVEALSRQIPGVVGLAGSVENDSFRRGLLDHPHYTRPAEVEGMEVPQVLLSGDHAAIEEWRQVQAVEMTARKRPDLLEDLDPRSLSPAQRRALERLGSYDRGGHSDRVGPSRRAERSETIGPRGHERRRTAEEQSSPAAERKNDEISLETAAVAPSSGIHQ